ncbi:MAG TPA: ABC transporter substrate-binding protein [Xanthobacteraceae bacterium]|jgi:branched-chain amino acid transport system substrate-binding protein
MKSFIAALALTFGIALGSGVSAQQPIKIGFVGTFSGPGAAFGEDMYEAFMLPVERNGGKLGGVAVQVIRKDSQFKPEVANQVTDELIDRDNVSIIVGITFSNEMMAIYQKVIDRGVYIIGSNASPSQLAGAQCSPLYFNTNAQNDQRAEAAGKYMTDKGYKRVYTMAPNYQAGKDYIAGFRRYYKAPLVGEVYTPLSQLDFQAELTQMSSTKPDAVYAFYPGGLGVQFIRQWRQSGLGGKIPLITGSTVDMLTLPALKEDAVDVVHFAPWGPDINNPQNKQFVEEFEAKYKRLPSEYAASAYDSALLLDSAIAKVKGNISDKNAFTAALRAADFKSVKGKFKFNHNHMPIQNFYVFEVVKDGNKDRYTHKTVAVAVADAIDAYEAACPMK